MILQYVPKMIMLVPSGCKKLQFLKLFKNASFVFRWGRTCLRALQTLITYNLLDSVIEKALKEDYSDIHVRFGHKKNLKKILHHLHYSEALEEEKKRKLGRIKHNILLPWILKQHKLWNKVLCIIMEYGI